MSGWLAAISAAEFSVASMSLTQDYPAWPHRHDRTVPGRRRTDTPARFLAERLRIVLLALRRQASGIKLEQDLSSFRGDAQHRTRNLVPQSLHSGFAHSARPPQ